MTALAVVAVLVLGGVDSLSPVKLNGLSFKAPKEWTKAQSEDNSLQWDEPASGASMAISVFTVDPQRPAKACLAQMVDALGKDGFSAVSVGAQPASKKVTTDYVAETEEQKTEQNKVTTTTVLGCNGKIRWVLTWVAKTSDAARFGPILKRVTDSISYGKAP
jgi:hypothetical protein